MRILWIAVASCAVVGAGTAGAAQRKAEVGTPAQVQRLLACRDIAAAQERLACFDRETSAMSAAIASKDLVFIDKEKARAARRSLFGFSVPDFGGLFGGGGEDEIKQVEGLVEAAYENGSGGWTVRLQDGSVWTQTDSIVVPLTPRRGDKVVIKRALLGSFFMKVGKQPTFRAKRIG